MLLRHGTATGLVAVAFGAGLFVGRTAPVDAQAKGRVFELRTYIASAGKNDRLIDRFRKDTTRLFEKHGMKNVGYWVPTDPPDSPNTLIYILAHESRDAATKSWEAFRQDPEWLKLAEETQKDGPLVSKIEAVFMTATDFSPIK
jgi:hypothetical protein